MEVLLWAGTSNLLEKVPPKDPARNREETVNKHTTVNLERFYHIEKTD